MENTNKESPQMPYELFGIECGEGWRELLRPIFEYIENYNLEKFEDNQIVIEQIKEKFGGLRVYCNYETDELSKLIEGAECDSWETCETCGSKEHIGHTTGWIKTICHNCIKKNAISRKNDRMWIDYKSNKKYIISYDENIEDKEINDRHERKI